MQLKSKYVKILCSVLMAVAPLLQPLYVSADTITSANVIGTNVYTEPISNEYIASTNNNAVNNTALVHIEVILDKAYLGWVNMGTQVKYKNYYYAANPTYWGDTSKTISGNYYVNGSTINIDVPISWNSQQLGYQMGNPGHLPESSSDVVISISNQSNVTPIGDLSTLQDILLVLEDIQNNVEIDVIRELQNIQNLKQWNVPFESISGISYMLNKNFPLYEFRQYNDYQFPIFTIDTNDIPLSITTANSVPLYSEIILIVMWDRAPNIATMNQYMPLSDGKWKSYERIYQFPVGNKNWCIAKYIAGDFTTVTASNNITHLYTSETHFTPIYFGYTQNLKYLSTDFALNFGLSNQLIDDIHSIAQGTTQSNQSASSESAANQQFASDSQDLMDLEDTMSINMDANLQQIDTNFDVGNTFGSKFLTSAQWVRNQFNTITNNTPFGTFISFSLLIGLSLLLVGKFL